MLKALRDWTWKFRIFAKMADTEAPPPCSVEIALIIYAVTSSRMRTAVSVGDLSKEPGRPPDSRLKFQIFEIHRNML